MSSGYCLCMNLVLLHMSIFQSFPVSLNSQKHASRWIRLLLAHLWKSIASSVWSCCPILYSMYSYLTHSAPRIGSTGSTVILTRIKSLLKINELFCLATQRKYRTVKVHMYKQIGQRSTDKRAIRNKNRPKISKKNVHKRSQALT